MSYESHPSYEYNPDPDQQITLDYPIQERLKPIEERPLAALGDLVIFTVMGGAFGGAVGTMSHAEVLALDTLVATTEVPERLAA